MMISVYYFTSTLFIMSCRYARLVRGKGNPFSLSRHVVFFSLLLILHFVIVLRLLGYCFFVFQGWVSLSGVDAFLYCSIPFLLVVSCFVRRLRSAG